MKKAIEYEMVQTFGQGNKARLSKLKRGGYVVENDVTGNVKYFDDQELDIAMKQLDVKF